MKLKSNLMSNLTCTIILVAACAIMPWYFNNGVYDIVNVKYAFTMLSALVALPIIAISFISFAKSKAILQALKARDCALWLLLFVVLCSVGTALSINKRAAFFGLDGRYNGLLLLLGCSVIYCAVRFVAHRADLRFIIILFILTAALQAALIVANWFFIDPFMILQDDFLKKVHIFLGTMGNVNFIAAYFCLAFPIAFYEYLKADLRTAKLFYGAIALAVLLGILVSGSDGAFIGVVAVVSVIMCSKDFNLCIAARTSAFGTVFFAITAIFAMLRGAALSRGEIASIFGALTGTLESLVIMAICALAYFACKKARKSGIKLYIICRVLIIGACAIIAASVIYVSAIAPEMRLPSALSSLRVNARWGSSRGYVWDRLLYLFVVEQGALQKLIGSGLESVNQLINPHYTKYIIAMNGTSFDTAHNEYLQYLMCTGVLGLGAWIMFLSSHIKRAYVTRKQVSIKGGIALALVCYAVQAFFNISMPVQMIFLFIIAALACCNIDKPESKRASITRGVISTAIAITVVYFTSFIINNVASVLAALAK